MILYFSATGNTKYTATQIAQATSDKMIFIAECIKENRYDFELGKDENLGLIIPTYFWGLPSIVKEFLEKLSIKWNGENYTYFVTTCGDTSGGIDRMANKCLKEKGKSFDFFATICMPDTWTPMYNVSNIEKVKKALEKAEPTIKKTAQLIAGKQKGSYHRSKMPMFIAKFGYKQYDKARKTSHFHVENSCIGCGLCEKLCPTDTIKIKDGKPTWIDEQCTACLSCLHHCPKFAIQYDNKTQKRGQYQHFNIASL